MGIRHFLVPLGCQAAGLPLVGLTSLHALAPVLRAWQREGDSSKGKKILIHAGAGRLE